MRIFRVMAIYIVSFFVVGLGCGYNPSKLLGSLSEALNHISSNLVCIKYLPDGISPLFIFTLSFALGSHPGPCFSGISTRKEKHPARSGNRASGDPFYFCTFAVFWHDRGH